MFKPSTSEFEFDPSGITFTEPFHSECATIYKPKKIDTWITKFQRVDILHTDYWGKMVFLDKTLMSSEIDKDFYHQHMVHIPMAFVTLPRNVLILGDGFGATATEVLRQPSVERCIGIDIDGDLQKIAMEYLPSWGFWSMTMDRFKHVTCDALKYLRNDGIKFDVVFSDLLADGCYGKFKARKFFELVKSRMRPKGVFCTQSGGLEPGIESLDNLADLRRVLKLLFKDVKTYAAFIPSFGQLWSWTVAGDVLARQDCVTSRVTPYAPLVGVLPAFMLPKWVTFDQRIGL